MLFFYIFQNIGMKLLFCYQKCSDLLSEKIVLVIEKIPFLSQKFFPVFKITQFHAKFDDNMSKCGKAEFRQEKLLKFEAEGQEFAQFLRSIEQFFQTVKGQNNFW